MNIYCGMSWDGLMELPLTPSVIQFVNAQTPYTSAKRLSNEFVKFVGRDDRRTAIHKTAGQSPKCRPLKIPRRRSAADFDR
jgi:hypothetical protein